MSRWPWRPLLTALLLFSVAGCGPVRPPHVFIVPDGYVGWVRINYDDPTAPPVPVRNGTPVLRIPASGVFRTSSPFQHGMQTAGGFDNFYVLKNGKLQVIGLGKPGAHGVRVWARSNGATAPKVGASLRDFENFFIGTETQFLKYAHQRQKPGPILPLPGQLGSPSPAPAPNVGSAAKSDEAAGG